MKCAPAGHPSLRARIAQALALFLSEHSPTEVGMRLGIVGSTVTRRGDDLSAWPAADLLTLAVDDLDLHQAVVRFLIGEVQGRGDSTQAVGDLLGVIGRGSALTAEAAKALADGRVSEAEARTLLALIRTARQWEDAHLIPSLQVCVGEG